MPPTLCIGDDSKCSSASDDCCACDASIGQTTCGWEEPATCRDGYVAVPTPGADGGMHSNPSCEYSCYPPGCSSDGAAEQCSGEYCTSPDPWGGHDCWAGSDVERCTCSRGSAKMTGATTWHEVSPQSRPPSRGSPIHTSTHAPPIAPPTHAPQGKQYYEYTCCPHDDFNQGEECGDYRLTRGSALFVVRPSRLAQPPPPPSTHASRIPRTQTFSRPPLSPAPRSPAPSLLTDRCHLACTARRSPPSP